MVKKIQKTNIKKKSNYSDINQKIIINKTSPTFFVVNTQNEGEINNNLYRFECQICGPIKSYKTRSALGKHMRIKHQEKWKCKYCSRYYAGKNSHIICKVKQKNLQQKFIKSFLNKHDPISFMTKDIKKDNFNIGIKKGSFIYYPNFILGIGHCSKCFYGLNFLNGDELAVKFALNKNSMVDYNNEGMILNKLYDPQFYPKLYNFNNEDNKEYLGMTLMGPDLQRLIKYTEKNFFKKDILIDIGIELINLLEYIHYNRIIHRDIKSANIVWGIYSNSSIKNKNRLYLIDFGYSEFIGKLYMNENKDQIISRKGTREFLSINSHFYGPPTPSDDLESLIYTLLYLSELGLPWHSISGPNKSRYKATLQMKINFDSKAYCGEEFKFLSLSLDYLKQINKGRIAVNYDALRKIFEKEKINIENRAESRSYAEVFCKEIYKDVSTLIKNENNSEGKEHIKKLFEGYPIDFKKLYDNIKTI